MKSRLPLLHRQQSVNTEGMMILDLTFIPRRIFIIGAIMASINVVIVAIDNDLVAAGAQVARQETLAGQEMWVRSRRTGRY